MLALALMSSAAMAEERVTNAALGAVRDVLGSIGAAAEAVNGYTAGPSISHSLECTSQVRRARRAASQVFPEATTSRILCQVSSDPDTRGAG